MKRALLPLLFLTGCATTGPHALSDKVVGLDRLTEMENILTNANGLTAKFDIESKGENAAKMTGTLHLYEGNALHVTAEGHFKGELVQLLLDSRDPAGISRTLTKGPSASSNRDPPASKLRETLALGISRMGFLHDLVVLTLDRPIEKADGGFAQWVKVLAPTDGHSDVIDGIACRRVDFHVEVDGRDMGEASVCVADATGLPIQRKATVHFPQGDMTVIESFKWESK